MQYVLRIAAVLAALLFSAACVPSLPTLTETGEGGTYDKFLAKTADIVVADLESALALATAADDKPAMTCYPVLIDWAQHLVEYRDQVVATAEAGVFTQYQRARNIRRRLEEGVPEEVGIACSRMIEESKGAITSIFDIL